MYCGGKTRARAATGSLFGSSVHELAGFVHCNHSHKLDVDKLAVVTEKVVLHK